ncbi:MAG TPA: hypothetical protein VKB52_00760 [Rhodanobacteraceae bacterium]|nr:hypothetical protein [Rhodanobacteraceae bacterium]
MSRPSPLVHLLVLVRDICQLRRGPEEMPYSNALFGLLVASSIALDLLCDRILDGSPNILARSLVSMGLILALCWIALSIRHLGNRYVQTASTLIACDIVFTLLILPLAWLFARAPAQAKGLTPPQTLLAWAMLAVIVWNLVVNAHIVRRALDAPFALGFALALAWALANWALTHALFDTAV